MTDMLDKNIVKLTNEIAKSNSLKYAFLKGMFVGLGTAIGATIVASLVVGILIKTIHLSSDIPILREIILKTNLEQAFTQNAQQNGQNAQMQK